MVMATDPRDHLYRMRDHATLLYDNHVSPAVAQACERMRGHHEVVTGHVRHRPMTSMLVAFVLGFVLGRAR